MTKPVSCQFIEEKKNLIFLGGVELGKTHLATAIGHQAAKKGYRMKDRIDPA